MIGTVYAAITYDDGTGPALYVGGDFSIAGTSVCKNIAKWSGAEWLPVGTGTDKPVRAFAIYNNQLIVGGEFIHAGGVVAHGVAIWNGTTWTRFTPDLEHGTVHALTVYNGQLIIGGLVGLIGVGDFGVARWTGTDWDPIAPEITQTVYAMTIYNGELIVGGSFTYDGDISLRSIARWNGSEWSTLGAGLDGATVRALGVHNGMLMAGGDISFSGNANEYNVAQWDGDDWHALGGVFNRPVYAITEHDGELIVGGGFYQLDGVRFNRIARWSGSGWEPLGYPGLPIESYSAFAEFNGLLVAAGNNGDPAQLFGPNIAAWDGSQWSLLAGGGTGVIRAFTILNGDLIVSMTDAAPYGDAVVRRTSTGWQRLGPRNSQAYVSALRIYSGELYAGGSYLMTTTSPLSWYNLIRWDGSAWRPVGDWKYSETTCLITYESTLVANSRRYSPTGVRSWDGNAWQTFPLQPFLDNPDPPYVQYILTYRGDLVAAGQAYQRKGNTTIYTTFITRWNGTAWDVIATGTQDGGDTVGLRLAEYRGDLIAAGEFAGIGGITGQSIARFDGNAWHPLGTGLGGVASYPFHAYDMIVYNGELIVTGDFSSAGGMPVNNIARWDGSEWHPLGSGLEVAGFCHRSVSTPAGLALTVYNGDLVVGGDFLRAGGKASAYWARWGLVSGDSSDADGDTVLGECDACPNTPAGAIVDTHGCSLGQYADFDDDGDVDIDDYAFFAGCFRGSTLTPWHIDCGDADFDHDADVDVDDFAVFARCFNGAAHPPACE